MTFRRSPPHQRNRVLRAGRYAQTAGSAGRRIGRIGNLHAMDPLFQFLQERQTGIIRIRNPAHHEHLFRTHPDAGPRPFAPPQIHDWADDARRLATVSRRIHDYSPHLSTVIADTRHPIGLNAAGSSDPGSVDYRAGSVPSLGYRV